MKFTAFPVIRHINGQFKIYSIMAKNYWSKSTVTIFPERNYYYYYYHYFLLTS